MSKRFKPGQEVFFYVGELTEDLSKVKNGVLKHRLKGSEDSPCWKTTDGWLVPESCMGENPETAWYRTAIWTIDNLKKDNASLEKQNSINRYYYPDCLFDGREIIHNEEEISRIEKLLFAKGFYCNQEQEENL